MNKETHIVLNIHENERKAISDLVNILTDLPIELSKDDYLCIIDSIAKGSKYVDSLFYKDQDFIINYCEDSDYEQN